MIAIQTIIEKNADILLAKGSSPLTLRSICRLKMNRWNTSALSAAIPNNAILSQNVGSAPKDFALVMNKSIPEGTISSKPLADHGNK